MGFADRKACSLNRLREGARMWVRSLYRQQDLFTLMPDPYPYAIDEAFDVYRVLVESTGTVIGMSGRKLNIIISGDSA
jgi:hypothetical protein